MTWPFAITLIVLAEGFGMPITEIEAGLSPLGKVKVEIVDLSSRKLGEQHAYFSKLEKISGNVHYLVPPFIDNNGADFILGGSRICNKRKNRVSYSVWNEFNLRGEHRGYHSKIAMLHEIGHKLGAFHDDSSCNVMHSNALACADIENLQFTKKTIREVKRCLK